MYILLKCVDIFGGCTVCVWLCVYVKLVYLFPERVPLENIVVSVAVDVVCGVRVKKLKSFQNYKNLAQRIRYISERRRI